MTDEQLLSEIEDVLRTMPPRATLRHETAENFAWLGRAAAVVSSWNVGKAVAFQLAVSKFNQQNATLATQGFREIMVLLQEGRHALRMRTTGPLNVAIGHGRVFDYFEELRNIIELARQDLLFVDPYLDADFVSRYLPHAATSVVIRLLTSRKRLQTLLPAVEAFAQQLKTIVQVRVSGDFHDRYVFIDRGECYQSGASFKDGARNAPTTLTQITDAQPAMLSIYENMWNAASVER